MSGGWPIWVGAAGGLGAVQGFRMVLRPTAYLGTGTPPASDPRTVRFFGYFSIAAGLAALAGALIELLAGGRS